MKVIALNQPLPIADSDSLQDMDMPLPHASGHDLLVKVEAISVNPVDTKVRLMPVTADGSPRVLGWDVAGVVVAVGADVTLFKVGDAVFYAGSITRPGANSEFHLVDERIVGNKPNSLSFAQAAALPLTSITSWEALFDRLAISRSGQDSGKTLLMIGGAGGVGSMAIQLAKQVAGLLVIATASRPESARWCIQLGADHVINHSDDIALQLTALGLPNVDYILCLNETESHFAAMVDVIAPQGKICSIDGKTAPLTMDKLFAKSATFVWEMMFTRSSFGTPDMIEQHRLLNSVAALVDRGVLQTTLNENFGRINATNLRRAHQALEARHTIGKIVLAGF